MHAVFRDYIKHEDTLVQYRITWLLVLTGMLLTTYLTLYGLILYLITSSSDSAIVAEILNYPIVKLIFVPIFLSSLAGLLASIVCFRSILGASSSAKSIQLAWERFKETEDWREADERLPELTFGFSRPIGPAYGYPKTVCVVVAVIWLISIAADVFLVGFFEVATAGLMGG